MKICGGIFDVDGTLLDSLSVWDTVGEDYLRSLGYEPKENLNEVFQSMSLYQAACYYQNQYGVALRIDEIIDGVNAMLERYYRYEVLLKPGAAEVLETFCRSGVALCIATATDRRLVEAALSRLNVLSCFSDIFTCNEVGHGKEEPHIFEAALRSLGTKKEETVVFEDAAYAIRTAKKAGFPVTAIYDPREKGQAEIRALADIYWKKFPSASRLRENFLI